MSNFTKCVLCLAIGFLARGVVENGLGSVRLPGITPQATAWTALADHITDGDVADTDELIRIVRKLDEQGHVDFTHVATEFPTIASTRGFLADPDRGGVTPTGAEIANEIRKL